MRRQLICINCPRGCHLEATQNADGEITVTGNGCARGVAYARQELTDPRRVVTAVVHTTSETMPWLPVKTDAPLPKQAIAPLLNRLYQMTVEVPVSCGETILADVGGTGVNVVATADCGN